MVESKIPRKPKIPKGVTTSRAKAIEDGRRLRQAFRPAERLSNQNSSQIDWVKPYYEYGEPIQEIKDPEKVWISSLYKGTKTFLDPAKHLSRASSNPRRL